MKLQCQLAALAAIVAMAGCYFPGQRLLRVRVEQNGQVVAEGIFSVPDSFDRQATWERLSGASLEAVGVITPEANDRHLAVLAGSVRVSLEHADRPYAAADAKRLRLVADPDQAGRWKIEPGEVMRLSRSLK